MSDLSPRKRQVLRAVVVEYVEGAEPVSSEQIVRQYELGVRSATVRNEMAEITELGYLEQPHTSAGRIPSDLGYRYYVDHLLIPVVLQASEQRRIGDATSEDDTLNELLRETTKALSRLTRLLSIAATIRNGEVTVRNVLVTAIGPDRALLVFVLQNGHVETRILDCPPGTTLEHLGKANAALGALVEGSSLRTVSRAKTPSVEDPVLSVLMRNAFALLRTTAREIMRGQLVADGQQYVIAQPEFQRDMESMAALLDSLEDEETLYSAAIGEGVTIGRENPIESMHGLSVIRKTFFVGEDEAGTLAVIGPTRLPYDRTSALLDFTARAVSETLTRLLK
ncbi:MAG: heat-inducible transcription repressor HrcA [Fimbriimonadaceae bacterium]|nr:heat-inducible transcription repressor HrcA [Fimbriimonadaceae bacterium]QYK55045.1 MAG: heat-inducible transcription repressor HrcA [Fimbriimonadaceae bacterium]